MAKLKLEELRTKEELINYFKQQGINITEDEIYELKQKYNKAQEIDSNLTMQQLDQVVGGAIVLVSGDKKMVQILGDSYFNNHYFKLHEKSNMSNQDNLLDNMIADKIADKNKIYLVKEKENNLFIKRIINLNKPGEKLTPEQACDFLKCVDLDSEHKYLDFNLVKTFILGNSEIRKQYELMHGKFVGEHKEKTPTIVTFGYHLFCSDFAKTLGLLELIKKIHLKNKLACVGLSLGVLSAFAAATIGNILLTANNNKNK